MAVTPLKVGLIGSGAISYTYLNNMVNNFNILDVVGCSDIIPERSKARAEQFGIRQMTNEEIYNDPSIDIVVNTTYPSSHTEVNLDALNAGKHLYVEKTMAATFMEAKKTVDLAKSKGLRMSAAPDTFLGGGYQTCRKLIDDGFIGEPISAQALLVRGYWAGAPRVFPRPGGMFVPGSSIPYDMGTYYLHALVHLLGPIARVSGFAMKHPKKYTHPAHPNYGESVDVTGSTTIQGSLEFHSGAFGNITVMGEGFTETPRIEIYGTEGTLICPDPNTYGGPVLLMRKGGTQFFEIPITHEYVTTNKVSGADLMAKYPNGFPEGLTREMVMWADSRRGIGVADMAWAIRNNRPHRCTADIDIHAMEVIYAIEQSCEGGKVYTMTTKPDQPKAIRAGFLGGDAEAALDD